MAVHRTSPRPLALAIQGKILLGGFDGESWEDALIDEEAPRGWSTALSFDATGQILAAGNSSGEVVVWDVSEARIIARLPGAPGPISALSFSPTAPLMASITSHGVAILYETERWQEVHRIALLPNAAWVSLSPSGHVDGSPARLRALRWSDGSAWADHRSAHVTGGLGAVLQRGNTSSGLR